MVNLRLDDDGSLVALRPDGLDPRVERLAQRFVETSQALANIDLPPITSIMYDADSFPSRKVEGSDRHNSFDEQNAPFWLNGIDPAFLGWNDDGTWWVLIRSDVKLGTAAGQKVLKLRIHDAARMWNYTNMGGLTAHDNTVGSGDCDQNASNAQRLSTYDTAASDQMFNDWVRKSAKLVTRAAVDGITAFTGKDFCGQYTYAYVFMLPAAPAPPSNNGWLGHTAAGHVRLYAVDENFYVGVEIDGVAPNRAPRDFVRTSAPAEAPRIYLDRGLDLLGLPDANDTVVVDEQKIGGLWEVFISGVCRSTTDLHLIIHTGNMSSPLPTEWGAWENIDGKNALGPLHVKADTPWAFRIVGVTNQPRSHWTIDFTGQLQNGHMISQQAATISSRTQQDMPVFGVDAAAGNIYDLHAAFKFSRGS